MENILQVRLGEHINWETEPTEFNIYGLKVVLVRWTPRLYCLRIRGGHTWWKPTKGHIISEGSISDGKQSLQAWPYEDQKWAYQMDYKAHRFYHMYKIRDEHIRLYPVTSTFTHLQPPASTFTHLHPTLTASIHPSPPTSIYLKPPTLNPSDLQPL